MENRNVSIRIEIEADSFEEMVRQLGGAARLFVVVPGAPVEMQTATEASTSPSKGEVVEPEPVDPPKKPRTARSKPESIELKAEPPAEPAPAPETAQPDKPLDFVADIHPAIVAYVNDEAKKTPDDPGARKKVFDEFIAHFKVTKTSQIPAERFAEVLAYIASKKENV